MAYEFIDDEIDETTVAQQPETKEPSDKAKSVAKGFKMFGYQPKAETIEKIRKPLVQYGLTPSTEFATSAVGIPGDIASVLNKFIASPITKAITGKEGVPYEETAIGKILPGSEQLHQAVETLAGEKLRPETTGQEILSTGAGFLGSIFGGGGGKFLGKGKVPFSMKEMPAAVRNTIAAFGPASVMVGTQKADLPPWMQVSATVGSALLAHRMTGKGLKQVNRELYSQVDEMAKDVMLPSEALESRLKTLEGTMQKGLKTSPKAKIGSLIDEMRAKISGGAVPLEDLIQYRKDIIESGKEFTKEQMAGSERFWKPLRNTIDSTIEDYGKLNSEFNTAYRDANSMYRGMKESQAIGNFIKKHRSLSTGALGAGGLAMKLLGVSGVGTGKALVAAKGFLFTRALARNPGFRKAWKGVLKNASKSEVRATARSLKEFNQIAKEEGLDKESYVSDKERSRYEFID